jgi:hypothetical protein
MSVSWRGQSIWRLRNLGCPRSCSGCRSCLRVPALLARARPFSQQPEPERRAHRARRRQCRLSRGADRRLVQHGRWTPSHADPARGRLRPRQHRERRPQCAANRPVGDLPRASSGAAPRSSCSIVAMRSSCANRNFLGRSTQNGALGMSRAKPSISTSSSIALIVSPPGQRRDLPRCRPRQSLARQASAGAGVCPARAVSRRHRRCMFPAAPGQGASPNGPDRAGDAWLKAVRTPGLDMAQALTRRCATRSARDPKRSQQVWLSGPSRG